MTGRQQPARVEVVLRRYHKTREVFQIKDLAVDARCMEAVGHEASKEDPVLSFHFPDSRPESLHTEDGILPAAAEAVQ